MPPPLLSALLALVAGTWAAVPVGAPAGHQIGWAAPLGPPLVVLSRFSAPPSAMPWLPGHRGVDLAGTRGASVRADTAGQVTYAGLVAGQGVVVVAHSARFRSTFEPVAATVRVGDAVQAGAQVGRLTVTSGPSSWGPSCPGRPCLHWGMVLDGQYVDPLAISHLEAAPSAGTARLLPLVLPQPGAGQAAGPAGPAWGAASIGALGGGPPGPPGGGAVLAVEAAAITLGAGSVAVVTRVRRRRIG